MESNTLTLLRLYYNLVQMNGKMRLIEIREEWEHSKYKFVS